MLELIKEYDIQLFLYINHLPHYLFLDTFFGFLTFAGIYGGIFLIFAFILYLKNKKKFKKLVMALLNAEIFYIILVEMILKNIIVRPRPQLTIADVILPYDFSQSFSFPSGHATMAFAAAFILGREYKKYRWLFYLLAFLISFSRIYLGKHYSSDVIGGAILGVLIGIISIKITNKINSTFKQRPTAHEIRV